MVLANTQLFPHDCRQAIFFKFPSSRWSDRDLGKVTCLQDLRVVCKVFNEAVDRVEQELQIVRTICCKSSSDAARLRIVRSVHTLIIGDGNITPHIEALLYSPSKDCLKVIQLPCKPLTKEAVSILSRLPSLTKLVLSAHDTIPLEEELATSISSITNLEKIDIDSTCGETTCTPLIQSLCQLKKIKKIKLPYVCLTLDMVKILQANLPLLTTLDTLVLDQPLEELPRIVCRYPWNEGKKFICDPTNDYPFVESALRTIKEITDEKAKYHFLFCAKFSSSENIVSYCVEHYFDFDNAALQMLTEMLTPDCAKHSAVVWLFTSSIYHERFDITRRLITLGVDLNCRFNAVFDETGGEDYLTVLHYCIKKIALSESSEIEQDYY